MPLTRPLLKQLLTQGSQLDALVSESERLTTLAQELLNQRAALLAQRSELVSTKIPAKRAELDATIDAINI